MQNIITIENHNVLINNFSCIHSVAMQQRYVYLSAVHRVQCWKKCNPKFNAIHSVSPVPRFFFLFFFW